MKKGKKMLLCFVISVFIIGLAGILIFPHNIPQYTIQFNESDNRLEITPIYDSSKARDSFGVGLYTAPIHSPEHSMHYSRFLNSNETFNGYLFVSNQMYDENDFLIFCMMDYKQVPFTFESEKSQMYHIIHLNPLKEQFYHFELNKIEKGVHDFEIFLAMKPYEHSLNRSYRLSTDFSYLGSRRVNIFVDDLKSPVINYTDFDYRSSSPCGSDYPVNDGLMLTRDPCSSDAWLTVNVTPGEHLNYWINIAADNEYPVSFGLIALMDYQQIPLQVNMPNTVIFGKLDAGEKISLPASIVVPNEDGIHELMAIWIPAPYTQLETSSGNATQIGQWITSEPSVRVGLNVSGGRNQR
jgi:hypothetical protein